MYLWQKWGWFQLHISCLSDGPRREKTCLRGFANNTGADQPKHPLSLISAFVIRFLEESIICKLATDEISISNQACVAKETALSLALSETPKTGFVASRSRLWSTCIIVYKACVQYTLHSTWVRGHMNERTCIFLEINVACTLASKERLP